MTEPRRSTRARAREDAAPPAPETPADKPAKKSTLKRKRPSTAARDATPGTPVDGQRPRQTLPLKVVDGLPLPTLPAPQPLHLPAAEWQNIQQSGVLSASLQRSRAVWVSGVNFRTFHRKYTLPKKVAERTDADKAGKARQREIEKNFPQIGTLDAQLVIEPHTFPIKLYAPKEGSRPAPKKMPPPQQYGAWPSHSQHAPHPQYQPYNQPYPPKQPPQSRPPPPKPAPPPAPGPASTPAPDPVIHMLAARAGTDPELKAVMKIVAAGAASKAQLEFFQTHINELTEILEKNKKAKAPMPLPAAPSKQPSMPVSVQSASVQSASPAPVKPSPTPAPPKQSSTPAAKQSSTPAPPKQSSTPAAKQPSTPAAKQPSTPAAKPSTPAAPKQESASPAPAKQPAVAASPAPAPLRQAPTPTPPRPAPPVQQQPPAPAPKPFSPAPPQTQQRPPPPQPRPHPPNAYPVKNYQPPYYQQPPPHYAQQPPPRITYRPLTFEFVEGNGDRFYFPSYSFMEWLPNGSGAKFSFLVTKLKPKPDVADKAPSTPAPPQTPTPAAPATDAPFPPAPPGSTAAPAPPPAPAYVAPPRIEDFDERNDMKDVDFYQPVTVLVLTDEHEVKSALPRAIRPPSVVEKYMEEVFDTCRRAEDTYLAFRLPKGGAEVDTATKSGHATPSVGTPTADVVMGGMGAGAEKRKSVAGRPRKSLPA